METATCGRALVVFGEWVIIGGTPCAFVRCVQLRPRPRPAPTGGVQRHTLAGAFVKDPKGPWWADFNDAQGRRRRINLHVVEKRVATESLNDKLAKVARREHLGVVDDSASSFGDFAEEWWQRVRPGLRETTRDRWRNVLEGHLRPEFGSQALRFVTLAQVEGYEARRLEAGAAPATVRYSLSILRHVYRRAVEWGYLARNPLERLRMPKEPRGRTRFLDDDEIARLLASIPAAGDISELNRVYLRPLVVVALATGLRRGEILRLERRDIDWQGRTATARGTKNGDDRTVPLNQDALEALRSLPPRLHNPRLFPFSGPQVSVAFERALKRAGIAGCRFHDLRHTAASRLVIQGVSLRAVQEILGHRTLAMVQRYSHLSAAHLHEAVSRIGIGALVEKPETANG